MATKELPISADQDGIPQAFSKNFDQTGNSSGFIFDVSLALRCWSAQRRECFCRDRTEVGNRELPGGEDF